MLVISGDRLVVSHALAGRIAEAKKHLARLLELDPPTRIANLKDWAPLRRREDLDFDSTDFDPEGGQMIVYAITRDEWASAA